MTSYSRRAQMQQQLTMHTIITWICVCIWWSSVATAMAIEQGSSTEPRCPGALPARCSPRNQAGSATNEFEYLVEDQKIIISYEDGRYLELVCNGWAALESSALPAFPSELRVPRVTLRQCPPPAAGAALARCLLALNVTLLRSASQGNLTLMSLPPRPPLQATHFAGLEDLVELKLIARTSNRNVLDRAAPLPGFLGPLRSLRTLVMMGVRLPPGELDRPPASLRSLNLHSTGIRRPPTGVLALPNLHKLLLTEDDLTEFYTVPLTLKMLSLVSKNTTIRLKSIPKLEILILTKWSETRPSALAQCDELVALQLVSPAVEALPAGWVGRCPRLERLDITNAANLTSLPSALLENATALRYLSLKQGVLETLPVGLLDDVPNLRTLDLTGNRLQMLPSGMFASPRELQSLNLSHNLLRADATALLAGLLSLTDLSLAYNPRLGDLCDSSQGYSRLFQLKKLTSLSLCKTSITHICRDWRDSLTSLKNLNLEKTNISELWYSDLRYTRDEAIGDAAVVRLEGAPVVSLRFSEEEFGEATVAARSGARVQLDGEPRLHCDCYVYWARLALALPASRAVRVEGLRCSSGHLLTDVPPDELRCAAPDLCRTAGATLPPRCACATRPEPRKRLLLSVRCDAAALTSLPTLPPRNDTVYELLLPNNNISALTMQDLPPHFTVLDLTNNSLERLEESVAWGVLRSGRKLLLGGNPLACDCRLAPLLQALHAAGDNASDLRSASCADGSPLPEAATHRCARVPLAAWLAATLAALLAVVALVVAYFAPPARRVLIKAVCYRWGLLRLPPEPPAPEGGFRFDAFVCFSHKDEDVVQQFIKRLEGASNPYRLCLHCRDWVPGLLISDQIGESMRVSRRTVVLVSNAFFESDWTQAEFREAYALALRDITPRLIVVLLDDPEKLPLDDGLQRYISTNTYVRWGDLRFWDKLQLALGIPLSPRPATATSPSIFLSSITSPATSAMSPTFVTSPTSSTPSPVYPVNSSSSTSPVTPPSTEQILLSDHVSALDDTQESSSVSDALELDLISPTDPLAARCLAAREQELPFPPTPALLPSCRVAVTV